MFQEITGNSITNLNNSAACTCAGECFASCSSACSVEYPRVYYRIEERVIIMDEVSGYILPL